MSASLLVQYLVVAGAVLLSLAVVLRRQFPGTWRRLRIRLALPLLREGRPAWLRAIGRRVAPPAPAGGDGCGPCSGCGPAGR